MNREVAVNREVPGIDTDRLSRYLALNLESEADCLRYEILHGGQSNLSYRVSDGTRRWLLRRPPLGHVLATAHDMGREFRMLRALYGSDVRVPEPILLEGSGGILGVPFVVMEWVEGYTIRDASDARQLTKPVARAIGNDLVAQLAAIHNMRVPPELAARTRPVGFMARQVVRWEKQWIDSGGAILPAGEELVCRLRRHLPSRVHAAIVHGDYRLDNTLVGTEAQPGVRAVIDWEMATVGDPLADLGLMLAYWDPVSAPVTGVDHAPSANSGFPTAVELVDEYLDQTSADLTDLNFYRAFGYFKLAAIARTLEYRWTRGMAVGESLAAAGAAIEPLSERGLSFAAKLGRR